MLLIVIVTLAATGIGMWLAQFNGFKILGALIIAGLVNVEKVADGDAEGFGTEAERGGMRGASVAIGCRDELAKKDGARDGAAATPACEEAAAARAQQAAIGADPTTAGEYA